METLKYTVITSDKQYDKYCSTLEELLLLPNKTKPNKDEIALLTLLIEKYDEQHNFFTLPDPITLLKSLLKDHKMKAIDLAKLLQVSEGLVSDMLNYKKGMSKDTIRILAKRFKLNQQAFNRSYDLRIMKRSELKNSSRNTKELEKI